jgi:hypothetical protein
VNKQWNTFYTIANSMNTNMNTLKAAVIRSESWPVRKDILGIKYYKNFKKFMDNILLNKEQCIRNRPVNSIDRE